VLCHSAPFLPPVFARFRKFPWFPAPARDVSSFVRIKKTKNSRPAAAPRERLRRRDKKVPIHAEKPLCNA
jgi:hypothetical protein